MTTPAVVRVPDHDSSVVRVPDNVNNEDVNVPDNDDNEDDYLLDNDEDEDDYLPVTNPTASAIVLVPVTTPTT